MDLATRIKTYEAASDYQLTPRCPVILRLDGRSFSNYTKHSGCKKPFDDALAGAMIAATLYAAQHIEDCVFGYTQSDEITLVLRNDKSLESQPWFDNRVQKLCSVSTSLVTAQFNRSFVTRPEQSLATFDCRAFIVPNKAEAINAVQWRVRDAVKNSISAACHWELSALLGRKTTQGILDGKNQSERQELLFQNGINWNDYPARYKQGVCCYREQFELDGAQRSKWVTNETTPITAEFIEEKLGE
jgi:tRNA(His) guanylyltransferase